MAAPLPNDAGAIVGRSKELNAISTALSAVATGQGRFLLFAGEPGIGKSTLARAIALQAANQGFDVHWGFCWEAGGAPACWPWTQLLRSILALNPQPGGGQLEPLAQLVPELSNDKASDEPDHLQPDQERFRLLDSVRALLQQVSAEKPLVLILEDLHVADADTLRLLQYISRHVALFPILLVGTVRETEARISPHTELLWQAARDATTVRPARLSHDEIREYLCAEQGLDADGQLVDKLQDVTEGNPLFLVELVSLLGSAGRVASHTGPLPESINQVIRAHLDRLPPETAGVLVKAAIFGREFPLADLAAPTGLPRQRLAEMLESAEAGVVIQAAEPGCFRFSHMLYRDVLLQGLKPRERESLHQRRAEQLAESKVGKQQDQWAEIATHLDQAGPGQGPQAVAAWRKAARQASRKLALDEAVNCLERAVETFGQGPGAEPDAYCGLLLDLAEALLVKGDTSTGRAHCREAYRIARTLEEAKLMTRAALVYGSVFVVADIDADLVGYLQESLRALPETEIALRARVAARLAAALQPAEDPVEPMVMARKAIELARSTRDDRTLYLTLRSAISALMDFAEPEERLALNLEYVDLAKTFHDTPEQFRGHLRMVIDAAEMGDAAALKSAIDVCDAIAERIRLPHYGWKTAACKAMQSLIHGDFDETEQYISSLLELGQKTGDSSVRQIVACQRLYRAQLWQAAAKSETRQHIKLLREAYTSIPSSKMYIYPLEALALLDHDVTGPALDILSETYLGQLVKSGERCCLLVAGEIALLTEHKSATERIYKQLKPFDRHCAHMGLLGMTWVGPVARVLGTLAMALDRDDEAAGHLEQALVIASRMESGPFVALTHAHMAQLARKLGDEEKSARHTEEAMRLAQSLGLTRLEQSLQDFGQPTTTLSGPGDKPGAGFALRREGDLWHLNYQGEANHIKHSKGIAIIAHLVSQPGKEMHVMDLNNLEGKPAVDTGDAGPQLDDAAREAYRARLEKLRDELSTAEELADADAADQVRQEMDFLGKELSRAFGLGGRQRKAGSSAERARVNVQRRIRAAVKRIEALQPATGKYLNYSIKTGTYCKYQPM